ncbi:MAG: class I SAM-dependent methyltransferase [Bacteriovoracaceae bacterium]|jgi:23S rRNA (cytosine1962-C5)-methyltransferase/23S rRNA (guanine2445-N2)-methyltransferase / 23S rRNA (guanine2069-N7)-methyltransferase|nr:class I SAM-dependent methyltransferase [Bacteriovoracaceae bacterium]
MTAFKNRLEKNTKHLLKWAKREGIESIRLYDRDIPEYPYIVELHNTVAIIWDKTNDFLDGEKYDHFQHVVNGTKEVLGLDEENIIVKRRFRQDHENRYEKEDNEKREVITREKEAQFILNVSDYLDTGLFLDHRPLRQLIYKEAKDKKVLNLFAYTCSVSVFAALGGASEVVSVDMSRTYLEWGKRNFDLNKISIDKHEFVQENALEFLKKDHRRYELIFLDPPTFSNSKRMDETFDVERDQADLVALCMKRLHPDGVLYFSNNKRKFRLEPELSVMFDIKDITAGTIPQDFHDKKIHHAYKITHKKKS